MTYYLVFDGIQGDYLSFDRAIIGESSFDKFWPDSGLNVLMTIVDKQPHLLEKLTIINERGKKMSVEQFLTEIKGLRVVRR